MMTMAEFMFDTDTALDNLDEVPEKYRGLYGENEEGKFVVSDAAKGIVEDYRGVSKSLFSVRADKKKVSDENAERRIATKAFEEIANGLGVEPGEAGYAAALKEHIDELIGKVKGGESHKVNLDKIRAEFDSRLATTVAEKDKEISVRDSALQRHLIKNAAMSALSKHKGSVDLLLPHVERMCKVMPTENGDWDVRVLDADGDVRMNSAGGYLGVEDAIEEMKTQSAFKPAFESALPAGTGTTPGSMSKSIPAQRPTSEMSAAQKISQGLSKGQFTSGQGRGVVT
jgi:hypothetical protein